MLEECSLLFSCQTCIERKKKKGIEMEKERKKLLEQTFLRSSLLAVECKRKIREARSSFKKRECMQQVL